MSNDNEESETFILSEILLENEEIIAEVNELNNELKNCKELDQINYDKHMKNCKELMMDLDNIIDAIDQCQKENDPNLESFESKKKSSKTKAQKSKKLIETNISKLDKLLQKNLESSTSTKNNSVKKNEKLEDIETDKSKKDDTSQNKTNKDIIEKTDLKSHEKRKVELEENDQKNKMKNEPNPENRTDNQDGNVDKTEKISKQSDDPSSKQKGILKKSLEKKEKRKDKDSISDNKTIIEVYSDNLPKDKSKKDVLLTNKENDNSDCYSLKSDNSISNDNKNLEIQSEKKEKKLDSKKNKKMHTEKNVDFTINDIKSDSMKKSKGKNTEKISESDNIEPEPKAVKRKDTNKKHKKDSEKSDKKDDIKNENKGTELDIIHEKIVKSEYKDNKTSIIQNEKQTDAINKPQNVNIKGDQNDDYDSYDDENYSDDYEESILSKTSEINKDEIDKNKIKKKQSAELTEISTQSHTDVSKHGPKDLKNVVSTKCMDETNSEILLSIENLPSGVRCSTLSKWSQENSNKSVFAAYLCPKLSESYLSYDLEFSKIRPQKVRIQRQIQLIKVSQLPIITDKFIVKSRHVRICLFDDIKPLSNIYVMSASVNPKDLKTWNFNSKNSDIIPSIENNDIFVRINHTSTDLSILLEFCIIGYKSEQNSSNVQDTKADENATNHDLLELSIGWTTIPIYGANGQPINSKKADYLLNGGTPFEKGIEVNSEIITADSTKPKPVINDNKKPHVTARIYMPNKENNELLDSLPDMVIGSTLNLTVFSFYRRILVEEILDCYQDLTSMKPVYSPFLVSFTQSVKSSDLLDTLRIIWNEKLKTIKAVDKKNYGKMNEHFKNVYLQFIYPLTKLKTLPNSHLGQQNMDQIRKNTIDQFLRKTKQDNLSVLLTDEYEYSPLTFDEFNYNTISRYTK